MKPQALLAWPAATIRGEPSTLRLKRGRVHTVSPLCPTIPRRQRGRWDPTHGPPATTGPSAGRWQECGLSMHHPIVGWPKTFLVHSHDTPSTCAGLTSRVTTWVNTVAKVGTHTTASAPLTEVSAPLELILPDTSSGWRRGRLEGQGCRDGSGH